MPSLKLKKAREATDKLGKSIAKEMTERQLKKAYGSDYTPPKKAKPAKKLKLKKAKKYSPKEVKKAKEMRMSDSERSGLKKIKEYKPGKLRGVKKYKAKKPKGVDYKKAPLGLKSVKSSAPKKKAKASTAKKKVYMKPKKKAGGKKDVSKFLTPSVSKKMQKKMPAKNLPQTKEGMTYGDAAWRSFKYMASEEAARMKGKAKDVSRKFNKAVDKMLGIKKKR